ncbi:MAG: class I SAM-dependent methyltransferase [Methanocellales archaeon]|nr:class I SAM-dependent methyltransferase [Methanocellales archaeon]
MSTKQNSNQSPYDDIYVKRGARPTKEHIQEILALAGNVSGRVLDVGCGEGIILQHFSDAVGMDISVKALLLAKKNVDKELVHSSATHLPFKEHSFDLLVLSEVIQYLNDSDVDKMLKDAKRVLKPSGRAIIAAPNKNCLLRPIFWIFNPFARAIVKQYGKDTLKQKLREHFEVEKIYLRPHPPWLPKFELLERRMYALVRK